MKKLLLLLALPLLLTSCNKEKLYNWQDGATKIIVSVEQGMAHMDFSYPNYYAIKGKNFIAIKYSTAIYEYDNCYYEVYTSYGRIL